MATNETAPAEQWLIRESYTDKDFLHIETARGVTVACTKSPEHAGLIAAAPELLKCCEKLLERMNLCCCLHAYDERVIRRAEKVIAKANAEAA